MGHTYIQGKVCREYGCSRIFVLSGKLTRGTDILESWIPRITNYTCPPTHPRYTYLEVHLCGHTDQNPLKNAYVFTEKIKINEKSGI